MSPALPIDSMVHALALCAPKAFPGNPGQTLRLCVKTC